MEIIWHGNTCFTVKSKNSTIVLNPDVAGLKGDIVLSSLQEGLKEIEGQYKVLDWPGEYECKGNPVTAYQAWTKSKKEEEADEAGKSTLIFHFEVEGLDICHLGFLGHTLTSDMVNKMGDVDVLLVPVGALSNLSAKKVTEIIEAIDPRVVIPMGDEHPENFLKDLGSEMVEAKESFVIKAKSDLPEDKRIYVLLKKM